MTAQRFLRSNALPFAVITVAALLVYWLSLGNEFVIWDDDTLVYNNPLTQLWTAKNFFGAFASYDPELYVPLTIISFQIEHLLIEFAPMFYHIDNLMLHILNAGLVFLLLQQLGLRRWTALAAAMIFTVHPINTEAVAWVSGRKDLLAAFFSLTALLAYLQWQVTASRKWLWTGLMCFLCAVLSKPSAIVLPAILLLIDWKSRGRLTKENVVSKIPFFVLSILFLIIGLYGKQSNISALSPAETFLLACKSTVFALGKFFWPSDLSVIYLQTDAITVALPQFWIPVVLLGMAGIIIAFVWWRKGVGCSAPTFGLFWFLLFLIPSFSNFAKDDVYFFSDRYIYLSQIGLLFILGMATDLLLQRFGARTRLMLLWSAATPLLLLLTWNAHARSLQWHDSETLYRNALAKNDRSVVMHYNLGALEHVRGNLDAAEVEYLKTIDLSPDYVKAHNNLGVLYKQKGQIDKALAQLRLASDMDSGFPDPHSNIGSILMDRGDIDGAIVELRAAIAVSETFAQAHINLGSALGKKGLYEEGLREFRRAFELAPQLLDGMPEIKQALENLTP
ncbi:MAG: tetratricopeptide repeat protein [Candidatus Peribacteraceae bacterium]|nr:tetratricopeptide repeat protein [Candidatus Peribacteraceae bacterium]